MMDDLWTASCVTSRHFAVSGDNISTEVEHPTIIHSSVIVHFTAQLREAL